jgi:hypothetical protein
MQRFPSTEILQELGRCNATFEELSAAEHFGCLQEWLSIYRNFHGPTRRRLREGRAIDQAQRMCHGHFVVVPCRDPSSRLYNPVGIAYRCWTDQLPDLTEASHYVDIFISPPDFSWTLLYGHEVDVFGGPEFSCFDWDTPPSLERELKRL